MKKVLLSLLGLVLLCTTAKAQYDEVGCFKHLSVGLNIGTAGVGIDLGTMVSNNFGLRVGFQTLPVSYNTDVDGTVKIDNYPYDITVDAEAKLGIASGKILCDYYPWKKSPFHITAGAFIGEGRIIKMKGVLADVKNLPDGMTMNDINLDYWCVYVDDTEIRGEGNKVDMGIKVNCIKPYIGIGFGHTVPMKHRVGVMGEFGIMFHGTPKIVSDTDPNVGTVAERKKQDGTTAESDWINVMESIVIYPQLSIRICGRIF